MQDTLDDQPLPAIYVVGCCRLHVKERTIVSYT
jgi:hypothetical protein